MQDIFVTQDEIVQRILTTLRLQLRLLQSGVPMIVAFPPHATDNLEAYDYFLRRECAVLDPYESGIR